MYGSVISFNDEHQLNTFLKYFKNQKQIVIYTNELKNQ